MNKYTYYLELAVQERDTQYVYSEGKVLDSIQDFIKKAKEASSYVITTLSGGTEKYLKDISPTRNKLKSELLQYQNNTLREYEQTLQDKLKEQNVSVSKQKNKKWYQNQLLKQKEVVSALNTELKNQVSEYKEQIKKSKEKISKLTRNSAIEKRLQEIEEAEDEIKKKQEEFSNLKKQIDTLFKERDELLLTKETATKEQIKQIDQKIKSNSRTVTKLLLASFTIFSYVVQYFINKFSGFR